MVDDNKHSHRRFSPGDQALLMKRCRLGDNCCVAAHMGKVVTVVAYAEDLVPTEITKIFNEILELLGSSDRLEPSTEHDYIIAINDEIPAMVFDYQLIPLGGYTEKDSVPEKPEVVH